jgi:hypothetical protein
LDGLAVAQQIIIPLDNGGVAWAEVIENMLEITGTWITRSRRMCGILSIMNRCRARLWR